MGVDRQGQAAATAATAAGVCGFGGGKGVVGGSVENEGKAGEASKLLSSSQDEVWLLRTLYDG